LELDCECCNEGKAGSIEHVGHSSNEAGSNETIWMDSEERPTCRAVENTSNGHGSDELGFPPHRLVLETTLSAEQLIST